MRAKVLTFGIFPPIIEGMMKLSQFAVLVPATIVAFASGCGRLTCDQSTSGICTEFVGSAWTQETAQSSCGSTPTVTRNGCSATNRVGRCTRSSGTTAEFQYHFYSPTYTATTAQSTCTTASGQFTAN